MARFTDGPEHARRRAKVVAALPAVDGLRAAAAERAASMIGGATFDVMPIATTVPVAVLASAMGVADVDSAVRVTNELCATRADEPARALIALTGGLSAVSVLFQARDATAALIAASIVVGDIDEGVRELPVHSTQRNGEWVSLAPVGTFGAGRHVCPGAELAMALAIGVLDALTGARLMGPVHYESRPNLRLPIRLMVTR
jgi:cytochrome P450